MQENKFLDWWIGYAKSYYGINICAGLILLIQYSIIYCDFRYMPPVNNNKYWHSIGKHAWQALGA